MDRDSERYKQLLLANRAWAEEKRALNDDFFRHLSLEQKPDYLWIGCSDSRVPAEDVTGTEPGELFVHRNIANMVIHTDLNLLSVLEYAVAVLKVKHVIVCGHYGCGGVRTSMTKNDYGLINKWLRHIKDVHWQNRSELESLLDEEDRVNRLVELNVIEQVRNLAKTTTVQRAWHDHKSPCLHGWVYDLKTGLLKPMLFVEPGTFVDDVYRYEF